MITFDFNLESQKDRYNEVVAKIKNRDFFQHLNFYVLPYMPEKFRSRIVYLPEKFEPELIYKKQKHRLENLEKQWITERKDFIKKLSVFFPNLDTVNIHIKPSLYGTIGSYSIKDDEIFVYPRYDRTVSGVKAIIITSLTSYYYYKEVVYIESNLSTWKDKQNKADQIAKKILGVKRAKSFLKILDSKFVGKLAEESAKYLEKLNAPSKFNIEKPEDLTRSEKEVLNLLLRNKNKLVTFDQIADEVWKEKAFEKYSEYAITTIIKKIKKKLKQKTDRHVIQAQRGVGYILHV